MYLCYIILSLLSISFFFFFFNDTATTEIYTLSLHDALPILSPPTAAAAPAGCRRLHLHPDGPGAAVPRAGPVDRKSTRLNSSHLVISYAVFCLKKKKNTYKIPTITPTHIVTLITHTYQSHTH